jgi:hypothetical protein
MTTLIATTGPSVRSCLAAARKALGVPLNGNREKLRSGGEDGLYRVHLESGVIVECVVVQHGRAMACLSD